MDTHRGSGPWVLSPTSILWPFCAFQPRQCHFRMSEPHMHSGSETFLFPRAAYGKYVLMNEVPLFLLHFLHFDFLPLGFNEQELSEEVRRNFVIYTLRRGKLKAYMYIHEHAYMCANIYACICVHTCISMCACMYPVYICVLVYNCGHMFVYTHCTFIGLYYTLWMSVKALRILSRYNS